MAGGGGGGDTGKSHQVTEVKLPAWVEAASQGNYARAQKVADRPYAAYQGPTVAGLSPEYYAAQGMLGQLNDYDQNYSQASDIYRQLGLFDPRDVQAQQVRAGQLKDTNLDPYLNPYIENVERRAIDNATRSGEMQQNKLRSEAGAAKAFGGSRQAVQQGTQRAETTRGIGDLSAGLRKEGYDTATKNALADITNRLAADTTTGGWQMAAQQANQQADIAGAGIKQGAAAGLTETAGAAQKAKMNEILQYLGIGTMGQEQQQREYDDKRAKWQDKRNYPLEQLNIVMSALGMSPYGRTETTDKTSESKVGGGGAGMMGGMMQMLPGLMGMFSDRSVKTDIEKVGHDPQLDLPIYAYRYKKDPKTYPKAVGPMAQDVEKKYPQAVRKVAGKRVIDLTRLAA